MKKTFLLLTWLCLALGVQATDYQDQLEVIVNGVSSKQTATISVNELGNGKYTLSLKNFVLISGDTEMGVGNITLENIDGVTTDGKTVIRATQNINITEGDRTDIGIWTGPLLGPIPVDMVAELSQGQLYTIIDIDMQASLGQIIKVIFGTGGYQIPNADFELFHTVAETYVEPNAWHSFESASGKLAALAGHHLEQSADVRPGTIGKSSVRLYSTSLFGIIANGTMTTGRMNADAMQATDTKNHAYIDMSLTDADANGDPFYARMESRPDSITVWVKFRQGTANADHPYATISAAITDGTYYQDPEDKVYTNVAGRASFNKIESKGAQWQRLSVLFTYSGRVEPKAIMVTLSTNADPGQGSDGDELFVDDLHLVYNAQLTALSINGTPIDSFDKDTYEYSLTTQGAVSIDDIMATANGHGAIIDKQVVSEGGVTKAIVTVTSGDLATKHAYTCILNNVPTENIQTVGTGAYSYSRYYNLGGQLIDTPRNGRVYIERQSNGSVKKTVK